MWSPNVIARRYKLENPGKSISTEAIYQRIYSAEGKDLKLKKLLVRRHKKRGLKRKEKKDQNQKQSIHTLSTGSYKQTKGALSFRV